MRELRVKKVIISALIFCIVFLIALLGFVTLDLSKSPFISHNYYNSEKPIAKAYDTGGTAITTAAQLTAGLTGSGTYYLANNTDSKGAVHSSLPLTAGRYIVNISYDGNEYYAPNTYSTTVEVKKDNTKTYNYILYGGIAIIIVSIGVVLIIAKVRRA